MLGMLLGVGVVEYSDYIKQGSYSNKQCWGLMQELHMQIVI